MIRVGVCVVGPNALGKSTLFHWLDQRVPEGVWARVDHQGAYNPSRKGGATDPRAVQQAALQRLWVGADPIVGVEGTRLHPDRVRVWLGARPSLVVRLTRTDAVALTHLNRRRVRLGKPPYTRVPSWANEARYARFVAGVSDVASLVRVYDIAADYDGLNRAYWDILHWVHA